MVERDDILYTCEELIELSNVNFESVDKTKLRELTEVELDPEAPIEKRIDDYYHQIGNPYIFLVNGTPVQISFGYRNITLDQCLQQYLCHIRDSDIL